jgi:hypothetical protein
MKIFEAQELTERGSYTWKIVSADKTVQPLISSASKDPVRTLSGYRSEAANVTDQSVKF